jgi:hypothetical protein
VDVDDVIEHPVLHRRPLRDKAQLAIPPQWQVVGAYVARAKSKMQARAQEMDMNGVAETDDETLTHETLSHDTFSQRELEVSEPMAAAKSRRMAPMSERAGSERAAAVEVSGPIPFPGSQHSMHPSMNASVQPANQAGAPAMRFADQREEEAMSEVIELPDAECTGGSILAAIIRSEASELIECPVKPPMCPEAKLAVTRDRRIVLLAATRQGLSELRSIGRAYNWLVENYALIAMALPQMSIDATMAPRLRLMVDHADLSAEILQPMLQSNRVTVQAYRRLRWGGKTGLLLEAA